VKNQRSTVSFGRLAFALVLMLLACAEPPARSTEPSGAGEPQAAVAPRRLVAGIAGVHMTLQSRSQGASNRAPGFEILEELVSAGLANVDDANRMRPQLAEAVPTLESGTWKLFPDGSMETTWRIRSNARWHDGVPVSTDDVLFTAAVNQDPELPRFRSSAFGFIDGVEALDPSTIRVRWNRPYIEADAFMTVRGTGTVPLPKHLLSETFETAKARFGELPYWREGFVGTGPYKVRDWSEDTRLILRANPDYVLGKPKIDEIEIRLFSDTNTLIANILAGELHALMGRGVSLEQAIEVRSKWREGRVDTAPDAWVAVFPQMLNPNPAVIGDVTFRRALLHAVDRQEMVESIQHGLVPVAHGILNPTEPDYAAVERDIVRYDYDPRRAAELIESLGHTRGGDGMFRAPGGLPLTVEVRTTGDDVQQKSMLAVADAWQRAGVQVEQSVIPRVRSVDREWRSVRPGFELSRYPTNQTIDGMLRYHSSQAPVPANGFTGANKSRYISEELDDLLDTYFAAIPQADRLRVFGRIVNHVSRQAVPLALFYDVRTAFFSHRVQGSSVAKVPSSTEVWNVQEWELKP